MHVRFRTDRGRWLLPAVGLVAIVLATATGSFATPGGSTAGPPNIQGEEGTLQNVDNRTGRTAPSATQRALVKAGSEARFNKFGAPGALSDPGTYLAAGLPANDVVAAREYLSQNRELLGLSADELAHLELVNAPSIGNGSAVLFRQAFGGLEAGRDGLVTVGVVDGKVAFLSSSLTTDTRLTNSVVLSPEDAVRAAAQAAGQPAGAISKIRRENGWITMNVDGYTDPARVRLVGVPTPTDGVRRAYEVLIMDVVASDPLGAMSYIDAENGALLVRDGIVRARFRQPGVEGVPRQSAARLLDERHPRALVLEHHSLRAGVRKGDRKQRVAASVGRKPGDGHFDAHDPRQQRTGDGEVEFERRQPAGRQLLVLGDPRLRVPVDEPVVRGPL